LEELRKHIEEELKLLQKIKEYVEGIKFER